MHDWNLIIPLAMIFIVAKSVIYWATSYMNQDIPLQHEIFSRLI